VAAPATTTKKTVEEQIKRSRNSANSILADLDRAPIFKDQKYEEFPSFDHAEINFGPLLPKGGFNDVFEVSNFRLPPYANDAVATETLIGDDDTGEEEIFQKFGDVGDAEDDRYDLHTARSHMSKRCIRYGNARYAVKRLRGDLSELDHVRGMIDLAIENKLFHVLRHPNIVKMRSISSTPRLSADTFLIG
jgi:hypothetical protein